jgi:hypothetical protein
MERFKMEHKLRLRDKLLGNECGGMTELKTTISQSPGVDDKAAQTMASKGEPDGTWTVT